jgi:hypothetical protein
MDKNLWIDTTECDNRFGANRELQDDAISLEDVEEFGFLNDGVKGSS